MVGQPAGENDDDDIAYLEGREDSAHLRSAEVEFFDEVHGHGREAVPRHVAEEHGETHEYKHPSLALHSDLSEKTQAAPPRERGPLPRYMVACDGIGVDCTSKYPGCGPVRPCTSNSNGLLQRWPTSRHLRPETPTALGL